MNYSIFVLEGPADGKEAVSQIRGGGSKVCTYSQFPQRGPPRELALGFLLSFEVGSKPPKVMAAEPLEKELKIFFRPLF